MVSVVVKNRTLCLVLTQWLIGNLCWSTPGTTCAIDLTSTSQTKKKPHHLQWIIVIANTYHISKQHFGLLWVRVSCEVVHYLCTKQSLASLCNATVWVYSPEASVFLPPQSGAHSHRGSRSLPFFITQWERHLWLLPIKEIRSNDFWLWLPPSSFHI